MAVLADGSVGLPRSEMLNIMVGQLTPETTPFLRTHFAKKLETYEQDTDGVTLRFADGSSARADVLVGAALASGGFASEVRFGALRAGSVSRQELRSRSEGCEWEVSFGTHRTVLWRIGGYGSRTRRGLSPSKGIRDRGRHLRRSHRLARSVNRSRRCRAWCGMHF